MLSSCDAWVEAVTCSALLLFLESCLFQDLRIDKKAYYRKKICSRMGTVVSKQEKLKTNSPLAADVRQSQKESKCVTVSL